MTSTTAWTADGPSVEHRSGRRVRHLVAVAALIVAFAVAGGAVVAAAGSVAWRDIAGSAPADGGPTAAPAVDDVDEDDSPSATDADDPDGSDGAPTDAPDAADEPTDHLDDPVDEDVLVPDAEEPVEGEPEDDASGEEAEEGTDDTTAEDEGTDEADEPELSTVEVQEKLREYGFLIGAADGTAGQQTTAAVMAFQRVNGLAVDGVVGPNTIASLLEGSAEPTLQGGPDDRIEVDLDRQLLHLIEGGERTVTLQVSSGNGETYTRDEGGTSRAVTPVGQFRVERRIHGLREAPLGTLYDPLYFHRGFAIHGSPSVPAYPASHGCVRVSKADAAWLIQRIPDGMPVHLYGGTHVFTP